MQHKEGKIQKKDFILKIAFAVILVGIVAFIFSNSLKSGVASTGVSRPLTERMNGFILGSGLSIQVPEWILRKLGHLLEYALLGLWLIITLCVYTKQYLKHISLPLLIGILVAVADETIQLYSHGRSGEVMDILIDFSGVLLGAIFALFFVWLFNAY